MPWRQTPCLHAQGMYNVVSTSSPGKPQPGRRAAGLAQGWQHAVEAQQAVAPSCWSQLLPVQGMQDAGYTIKLAGHSLGAGLLALLGLMLRKRGVDRVKGYGFATPPCCTAKLAKQCEDWFQDVAFRCAAPHPPSDPLWCSHTRTPIQAER